MRHLQKLHEKYSSKNLVILGFNCSDDRKIALEFLGENGAAFPTILDSSEAAVKVGFRDYKGSGVPLNYIIDPQGKIMGMEVLTPEVGRNVEELIRQVKAYQHVQATGEVTPSGWQPGDITLTPGPALVGKVWEVWKPKVAS